MQGEILSFLQLTAGNNLRKDHEFSKQSKPHHCIGSCSGPFHIQKLARLILNSIRLFIQVAIKIIDMKTIKEDYVRRHILREALIMKKVQHANIVKLYETLKHDCLYCLVTELVNGGDLRAYVHQQKNKKITEGRARVFFRQLSSAVKHLHDNNIVHRWGFQYQFLFFLYFDFESIFSFNYSVGLNSLYI